MAAKRTGSSKRKPSRVQRVPRHEEYWVLTAVNESTTSAVNSASTEGNDGSRLDAVDHRGFHEWCAHRSAIHQVNKKSIRSKSLSPVQKRRKDHFEIGDDSSGDEHDRPTRRGECSNSKTGGTRWDIEDLFEFDVDQLVGIARNTAWGLPSCLEPSMRDNAAGAASPKQGLSSSETADSLKQTELHRLRREAEVKDKQIERLRRVVCELLIWGQQFQPSPTKLVPPTLAGSIALRSEAPEFVPLGISWSQQPVVVAEQSSSVSPSSLQTHTATEVALPDHPSEAPLSNPFSAVAPSRIFVPQSASAQYAMELQSASGCGPEPAANTPCSGTTSLAPAPSRTWAISRSGPTTGETVQGSATNPKRASGKHGKSRRAQRAQSMAPAFGEEAQQEQVRAVHITRGATKGSIFAQTAWPRFGLHKGPRL